MQFGRPTDQKRFTPSYSQFAIQSGHSITVNLDDRYEIIQYKTLYSTFGQNRIAKDAKDNPFNWSFQTYCWSVSREYEIGQSVMFFRQLILKPSLEFHENTNIRPCVYNPVTQTANYISWYDVNDFYGINHITARFD
ncbi:hypothetical protein K0M31_010968 [Melipona bicolor]|uniref:Uncharacterized protein n=1 Tax=Melipona bicolor TaxID=60889 RepID=A0AA40KHS7_9HYME|nr:hypothetical protein K0M31_010968 [Melipona bicolor]